MIYVWHIQNVVSYPISIRSPYDALVAHFLQAPRTIGKKIRSEHPNYACALCTIDKHLHDASTLYLEIILHVLLRFWYLPLPVPLSSIFPVIGSKRFACFVIL